MSNLSATNFREPLLRTLAELSEYAAGVAVTGTDTYTPVMALMGIADENAHGTNKASGQPMVFKWIQWANTSLREKGLTEAKGRGKWALTAAGLQEAVQLQQKAGVTLPTPAAAPVVPVAAVVAAAVVLPPTEGVSVQIGTVASRASFYSPDAYITSLAIETTGCVGKYSPHGAAVCTDCPLRNECRNQQAANLSKLAKRLAAQDRAALAPKSAAPAAASAPAAAAVPAAPAANPGKVDVSKIDFSTADVIKSRMDLSCEACGKDVKKGERCRWVSGINENDESGVFHLDCSGGAA